VQSVNHVPQNRSRADFFSSLLGARQSTGSPAAGGDGRVEITLANGRKIAVGATIDPMALARLVQVLDRA
jgi:hypothetical protein